MKVFIEGTGEAVSLGPTEFVGKGGEGAVYARGDTAYKIFDPPTRMIPIGKVRELRALVHPRVLAPRQILLDASGQPVGYAMRFLSAARPVCTLFPRAVRERLGIDPAQILALVEDLADTVRAIHRAGLLIVDLNELNLLVDDSRTGLWSIDVDSFQTPNHPATAFMDSVRDRHAPKGQFTPGTDWFSFAVVTFQLFIGLHPYRGKHPAVKGLDNRMQANLSAFHPDVRLPPAASPLASIPEPWQGWYRSVLQDGQRSEAPPTGAPALPARAYPVAPPPAAPRGGSVRVVEVRRCASPLRWAVELAGRLIVRTDTDLWVDQQRLPATPGAAAVVPGRAVRTGTPVVAWLHSGRVHIAHPATRAPSLADLGADLHISALCAAHGRLVGLSGASLVELNVHERPGEAPRLLPTLLGSVLPQATRLFPGCALQNLLGTLWFTLLPSQGGALPLHLPELDGHTVVDARFERRVLAVLTHDGRQLTRWWVRLSTDLRQRDVWREDDVPTPALDFAVLARGLVVHRSDDGRLVLFDRRPNHTQRAEIDPPSGDWRLAHSDERVLALSGPSLLQLRMS